MVALLSIQPSSGKDLVQFTVQLQGFLLNAMSITLPEPAPSCPELMSTPMPAAPPVLVYSKVTLVGPEGTGQAGELVQSGVNWCVAGKG